MEKREVVSQEIINAAYENFVRMFHPTKTGAGFYLWGFIGDTTRHIHAPSLWNFKPLQIRRLRGLAGPHHETIAKIMILQGCDPYKEWES